MSDVLHLTVFAGVSVVVCLLSHRLEQALAHAMRFERHLERSNQRLDVAAGVRGCGRVGMGRRATTVATGPQGIAC